MNARTRTWILAARPKTLTAALVPVVAGTTLAAALGAQARWDLAAWALLSAMAIQVGTNFFNDAIDFHKGADNAERLGPTRAVAAGLVSHRTMLRAGALAFAIALLACVPLVARGGWPILGLGLVSLACGYLYTGGPAPLAYVGLGDLFVVLFFGLAAVVGTGFLHLLSLPGPLWLAGLQIGLLAAVLIAVNNLRDIDGDRKVGKHTMAVRLGKQGARWEIALLALAPFALNLYWWQLGFTHAALLPLLSLPLAVKVVRAVFTTEPGVSYNRFLAQAAGLHLLFGVLLGVGFAW